MNWTTMLVRGHEKLRRTLGVDHMPRSLDDYRVDPDAARRLFNGEESDLTRVFFENKGRIIFKWLHFFPIYERYLERYRGTDFRMLEIGVFKGGSLAMWRDYFGPAMTLFGIDINPECAGLVDAPNHVRIGSRDDPQFLRAVVEEMGGLDVVLDDGSHIAEHQQVSFDTLFPLLAEGGLYIIEDAHTAYWAAVFNGGYRRAGTAIELAKGLVDDMHHWYHGRRSGSVDGAAIGAVHFYDSVIVIEKHRSSAPVSTQMGVEPAAL